MTAIQRLPGFENIRPPRPSESDEHVALRAAQTIVDEVNLDDFYWTPEEKPGRVWELQQSIMKCGRSETVYGRLPRGWHWEGMREHFLHIYWNVLQEALAAELAAWKARYGVSE